MLSYNPFFTYCLGCDKRIREYVDEEMSDEEYHKNDPKYCPCCDRHFCTDCFSEASQTCRSCEEKKSDIYGE
jgi:hypothetical protein